MAVNEDGWEDMEIWVEAASGHAGPSVCLRISVKNFPWRHLFAGLAMAGIASSENTSAMDPTDKAGYCRGMAEHLLAALGGDDGGS